ncbi:SAM-dependent methyltransferase [Chloroflexota bacterium]
MGYTSKWEQKCFPQPLWEPTSPVIVKKMLELAQVRPGDIVYDLGCGDARILITAVKEYGAKKAVGYEINEYLYEQSTQNIQSKNLQNRITLIKDDLVNADISEASVITLFLSMAANECLKPKLEKEAKPLTRIVSYFHPMTEWKVNKTKGSLEDGLYLYVMPD